MSPISRPRRDEVLLFDTPAAFHAWLEEHHASAPSAWIGYYRAGVEKSAITYAEAVEEGLCFGWIDGITYGVDDEVRASRFTPRRRKSVWSAVNVRRALDLIEADRMTPAGLAAFEARDPAMPGGYSSAARPADLPPPMLARLRAVPDARAYWESRTDPYRRSAADWVVSAKRQATRERRLEQLIADSAAGRPIKLLR